MKTTIIALIALSVLMLGCVGETPKTPDANTPSNGTTGTPGTDGTSETQFINGTFNLAVTQCYGSKIRVLNNGTGTAYLDSSVALESINGATVYGAIPGNTTIQPAETKIIDLPKDLNTLGGGTFSLHKTAKKTDGGTINYRFQFTC